MIDPVKILPDVQTIVRQAGSILMNYFRSDDLKNHEKSAGNPVTEADLVSEKFLIQELGKLLPSASFFAEESGKTEEHEYCFVIDPLDGTVNFSRGLDYFCVSVALTKNNVPILGCIYRPTTHELFSAVHGHGAYLNDARIFVSTTTSVDKAFVGVCLPYIDGQLEHAVQVFGSLACLCYGVRKLGAAALDQANVACGRLDATMFEALSWWDVAAGMLIVQEAGGVVSDYQRNMIGPDYQSFIATNKELHKKLLNVVV